MHTDCDCGLGSVDPMYRVLMNDSENSSIFWLLNGQIQVELVWVCVKNNFTGQEASIVIADFSTIRLASLIVDFSSTLDVFLKFVYCSICVSRLSTVEPY